MKPDDLITEARAKIIWGEPSSSVRSFLTSNGMSETDAAATIEEFDAERNAEIRKIGIKNTIIGGVLTGLAGILLYLILGQDNSGMNYRSAIIVGVIMLMNGIIYLVRPQTEEKSITEI